jgi:hypothetical protein
MKKHILLSLVILIFLACLCGVVISAAGIWTIAQSQTVQTQPNTDAPLELIPFPTVETEQELPEEIRLQMDTIQAQVSQLRGLEQKESVPRFLLTADELRVRVETDFFKDYSPEEAADDVQVLAAFGLLSPDFDLYGFYRDLYSEQVAGYYDPETKEMYVVRGTGFQGTERMTYAHEFNHALQDQTYDLREGLHFNDEDCEENSEYCAAVSALIEGDAVITEETWLVRYGTKQDRQQIQDFYGSYQSPVFDSAPQYMQEDFLFPYTQGYEFASTIYDESGFAGIDSAFRNPPVSTEQILHPEKYPDDAPESVTLPDVQTMLGDGWRELDESMLGEWYTSLVLSAGNDPETRLESSEARNAAAGWGGDRYLALQNDATGKVLLIHKTLWENENEAREYSQAFQNYAEKRWGERQSGYEETWFKWKTDEVVSILMQSDRETIWLLAPDQQVVDQVLVLLYPER